MDLGLDAALYFFLKSCLGGASKLGLNPSLTPEKKKEEEKIEYNSGKKLGITNEEIKV